MTTIVVGWLRWRYSRLSPDQPRGLRVVPTGIGDRLLRDPSRHRNRPGRRAFYLLVLALFAIALLLNYTITVGYRSYVERTGLFRQLARTLVPVLPSELIAGLIAVGITYAFVQVGLAMVVILILGLIVLQYLIGALLISQQRADELELKAKQLAGFQVALLGALLRTLDLRDRMTARHSAAVARYSREIAAAAGLSEADQELVHTAGLLHDIGKFVLPDRILKGDAELTEADWEEVKTHPTKALGSSPRSTATSRSARSSSPTTSGSTALGYPRGLSGEEIPILARIISVADTYDVLTARDSYREPVSSMEAMTELRRVSGTSSTPDSSRSWARCSPTRASPIATARTPTSRPSSRSTAGSTSTSRLGRPPNGASRSKRASGRAAAQCDAHPTADAEKRHASASVAAPLERRRRRSNDSDWRCY